MPLRLVGAALLLAALSAGCSVPETPAETAARRDLRCREAGFTEADADFKLCLLLQQTNERLAAVERRLSWIEQQVGFGGPPIGPRGWWW
jgi:hypothetical protein